MFSKKGFSLVELMIVVAIIGILAAIAIPNFMEMQYKAKRAEAPGNVDGIKTAEMAYDAAFDQYVALTASPDSAPSGKKQVVWADNGGYSVVGWTPDGKVRGAYSAVNTLNDFTVTGLIDVDGDTEIATYTATATINAVQNTDNDVY